MIITDEKREKMSSDVITLDSEFSVCKNHRSKIEDVDFIETLETLYSNYLNFTKESYSRINDTIYDLAIYCIDNIGTGGLNEAAKQFSLKNPLRNACWINVGIIGQITEIQAKMERIMNGKDNDKDTVYDAWTDLYNYCKFAIVCYRHNVIGSIYMKEEIILK